jgi:hypothetical protein
VTCLSCIGGYTYTKNICISNFNYAFQVSFSVISNSAFVSNYYTFLQQLVNQYHYQQNCNCQNRLSDYFDRHPLQCDPSHHQGANKHGPRYLTGQYIGHQQFGSGQQ